MVHHGQTVYGLARKAKGPFRIGCPHTCTNTLSERVQLHLATGPPLLFHQGFLLLSPIYPACILTSIFLKLIYLWLSWECDVEEGGGLLPGVDQRLSWRSRKYQSPKSPLGMSEGLHSCLTFGVGWIITNYFVIIMS